jgi:hypothetical protein
MSQQIFLEEVELRRKQNKVALHQVFVADKYSIGQILGAAAKGQFGNNVAFVELAKGDSMAQLTRAQKAGKKRIGLIENTIIVGLNSLSIIHPTVARNIEMLAMLIRDDSR